MPLNPRSVYTIAKKEFADNVRNKWIITMVAIFIVLTIAASVMAGGGELGEMGMTVGVLSSISGMLLPIISIMLGYAAVSGEAESGALAVVLACPVRRFEVLLGKYIGLGSVICFSVLIGFGVSGAAIAVTTGEAQWGGYVAFMLLSMLLGMLYLSLSLCFSSVLKRRVTSLAAGIVVFFWGMIIGMVVVGIFMATGGSVDAFITGDMTDVPDWLWFDMFLSPQDGSGTAVMLGFGETEFMGYELELPSWVSLGTLVLSQLLWTLVPLVLAFVWFQKRDI